MLSNNIFYHSITRKTIIAFGSLFSNIKIKRDAPIGSQDELATQTIHVPIAYAPKEKWIVKLEQDPSLTEYTYSIVPRMSFEVTNIAYDAARRVGKTNIITCSTTTDIADASMSKMFAPVPYDIDISLYVLTKTTEDGLQIIEQIVPYFAPEFTMSFKAVPESNVIIDIPIVLNNVSVQDDYDGNFETRRWVTWTLNFTLKTNFFGPVSQQGIITKVLVDVTNFENLTIEGDLETGGIKYILWEED
jgi:hypothetical protein